MKKLILILAVLTASFAHAQTAPTPAVPKPVLYMRADDVINRLEVLADDMIVASDIAIATANQTSGDVRVAILARSDAYKQAASKVLAQIKAIETALTPPPEVTVTSEKLSAK